MRRLFLYGLAALESAVAAALVVIALQLPTRAEVSGNFTRVAKVTDGAEKQVRVMRDQVADLREQDLPGKADQLRRHTRTAADTAGRAQIDFRTVEAIARSLADVSKGLNTWADTVDAERMRRVSAGLGEAAAFLDDGVAGQSEKSAAELETALAGLEKDATRLATLLRQSPPDLKAARTIYDGLGSFDNGLDKLGELVKPDRVEAMKEGLAGLEGSLTSTATEVDKVSALSYPVVTLNGLRPNVETKPFWPDGEKVADGLRKATKGVQAANKELEAMGKSLPEVQKALADSRKSVATTRESLGKAIRHQEETEKLLKRVPEQTAALAEALPRMGKALAQMLRETKKLRDLATGLRAVRNTLDNTLVVWPDVASGLKKSAGVLDQARVQLDSAAANREEYEKAMESSSQVARSLADMLPAFTDQFDSRLGQQEASLEQMETGLSEVNESLPVIESKTNELVGTVKWLLYLVAGLVALHAGYVLLTPARGVAGRATPRAADPVTT
jgi:ABC-type transporter Mla subunit MlaD